MTDGARQPMPTLQLRVPAAVVRMALVGPGGGEHLLPDAVSDLLLGHAGVFRLDSGLFIVVPAAGDEAVFDAAVVWARTLEEAWGDAGAPGGEQGLSTLILPGVAVVEGTTAQLLGDFLLDDLRRQPPELGPGIYVTGRAATMLEYPPMLASVPEYEGPSGKAVSLLRLGEPRLDHLPWRNPEVFGHATPYVTRSHLELGLSGLLAESVTRVSGSLGCGKTRLVWEHLSSVRALRLWLRVRPERTPTPSLAEQVIHHLLLPSEQQERDALHPKLAGRIDRVKVRDALGGKRSGDPTKFENLLNERALAALDHLGASQSAPVFLIVDDLHRATKSDTEFVSALLTSRHLGLRFRVVLVGRGGIAWPRELEPFPVLDVPPLNAEEMAQLTGQITEGLSIPSAVKGRFIHSVQGYPFAFEEGLFALIHEKYLRRVYGNFFFGGDETTQFQPSHRFVRHVEAEVGRLGAPLPVRLLSLIEVAVPASELAAAASLFGDRLEPGWEHALLEARILRQEDSPWGHGLRIVSPVSSRALAHGFPEESALIARHQLGELLALSGQSGESHWRSYRLLAGTAEALEPLMQVFKTSYAAKVPREELLDALTKELRLVRTREGDEQVELQLLWRLLPLARRMGCLNKYEEDLAHGIELARSQPRRLLALATIKAELEQEAGKYSRAETTIQEALKAAANTEARRKALLMIQLGRLFLRQNRFSEAEQLFSNLQKAFREVGSSALAATCHFFRGNIALRTGRLDAAMQHHEEALEERRRQNLLHPIGMSLSALGTVAMTAGHYPRALEYYRQAQEALEEHGREGEVA
ncbi:MAG: tetratricopeptide repeat protein, partial [Acidobacteriota bacterium]|nr:tetratricopeptide repeat protein [Acidobacteriota bacterium]